MAKLNNGYWYPEFTYREFVLEPYESQIEAEKCETLAMLECLKDKLYEQKSMLAAHYVTDAQLEYKYFINKETVV